jgi:hypothetical protein
MLLGTTGLHWKRVTVEDNWATLDARTKTRSLFGKRGFQPANFVAIAPFLEKHQA